MRGKRDWKRLPDTPGFRQDTHEPGNIRGRWLASKRILHREAHKIAAFAQNNRRFKRELAKQRGTEFCSGSWFTDDKGARRTYIEDIVAAQFSCKDAWAKRSVSANIDTPQEDNKRHTADYEEKCQVALQQRATQKQAGAGVRGA